MERDLFAEGSVVCGYFLILLYMRQCVVVFLVLSCEFSICLVYYPIVLKYYIVTISINTHNRM